MASVNAGKTAPKSVSGPGRTSFVYGSRPPSLKAQQPGSLTIKPQPGSTTQYGKTSVAGAGFGNTGMTGES
jgi:hypothetical protein